MMTVLLIMAIVFILSPIAQGYAKRLNQQLPPDSAAARAEVARLREEVDQLSAQVTRLQDEQAFTLRLLSEGRSIPLEEEGGAQPPS
jgi:cell division protein FtsB